MRIEYYAMIIVSILGMLVIGCGGEGDTGSSDADVGDTDTDTDVCKGAACANNCSHLLIYKNIGLNSSP